MERLLTLPPDAAAKEVRARVGWRRRQRVIAVFGTTTALEPDLAKRLAPVGEAVIAAAAASGAVIVTGGTDAGVIRMIGRAARSRVRLLGVAPLGMLDGQGGDVTTEPHHDVIVGAPGAAWGDETPEMERVIDALSSGCRVVAVLLGGGEVSLAEVEGQLRAGRPVVVVAGSGRLADELARTPPDTGDVIVVDMADGSLAIEGALTALLTRGSRRRLRDRVSALSALPSARRPRPAYEPFLGFAARVRFPELADEITEAEAAIREPFIASDTAALLEQRRHRFLHLATVLVGAATTTLAAVQVAIPGESWPAVVVTTLAAGGTALTAAARRGGAFEGYLRERTAAERLKSAFFLRLAFEPLADPAAEDRRRQQFSQEVVRMRYGGLKP